MTHNNHDDTSPIERARAEVHQAINDAPERSRRAAATEGRRWYRQSVLAAFAVAALVALCFSSAALVVSGRTDDRVTEQELQVATLRQLATDAKGQGEEANAELARRGQAQVPIPTPGNSDDAQVLVASATARVLASLPDARPTAAQLGEALARFVAANPTLLTVTPQQIAASLAGYFQVNPPPSGAPGRDCDPAVIPECRGPQGPKGEKGAPPTSEQIQAEFAKFIQDNPNALCPRGGQWGQLQVRLTDGGWADVWDCVVAVHPPPTTTTTRPPPPSTSDTPLPLLPPS